MSDKEHNDGGPAFPDALRPGGMSLRDWFAGQALAGMTSNKEIGEQTSEYSERHDVEVGQTFARSAYEIADAMLAARKEKQ